MLEVVLIDTGGIN